MNLHHNLPTLDDNDLTTATGGGSTRFYPSRCDAQKMARQLEKWNPDLRYDVRSSQGRYYVSNPYKPAAAPNPWCWYW